MSFETDVNVVFVHGAWHDGSSWTKVRDAWNDRSVSFTSPDLASVDGRGDLSRDVATLVAHCDALTGPKVLVGHSYGGAVITQGAASVAELRELIYVAALKPGVGESVSSLSKRSPTVADLDAALRVEDGQIVLDLARGQSALYERDDADFVAWFTSATHPQSIATFTEKLTSDVPHHVATTYILCQRDRCVTPELQALMARSCDRVIEIDSGHCPNVDDPRMLAELLRSEVERMRANETGGTNC